MKKPNYCPEPECSGEIIESKKGGKWLCRECGEEFEVWRLTAEEVNKLVEKEIQGARVDSVTDKGGRCGECGEDLSIRSGTEDDYIDWVKVVCSNCGKINLHSLVRQRRVEEEMVENE